MCCKTEQVTVLGARVLTVREGTYKYERGKEAILCG